MSKTIYCGECEKFAYEDTDGYGFCLKTNMECRCSDKCRIYMESHESRKGLSDGIDKERQEAH